MKTTPLSHFLRTFLRTFLITGLAWPLVVHGEQVANPQSFVDAKVASYQKGLEAVQEQYRKFCVACGRPIVIGGLVGAVVGVNPVGGPGDYVIRGGEDGGYDLYSYELNQVDNTWYGGGTGSSEWGSNPYSYSGVERLFSSSSPASSTSSCCVGNYPLGAEGGGSYSFGLRLDAASNACTTEATASPLSSFWISFHDASLSYEFGPNILSGWSGSAAMLPLGTSSAVTLTHGSGKRVTISFGVSAQRNVSIINTTWH